MKLVTTLIANTQGDGKSGDDFWRKAETLLYTALIGYIYYEAPVEEQNFATLIEMINTMEVREDDEDFKNPVDLMFEALEKEKPDCFAVRQYKKYKLAAGETDKAKRQALYDQINQLIYENAVICPMYQGMTYIAYNSNLEGVYTSPAERHYVCEYSWK